jgi:hypothetical protein
MIIVVLRCAFIVGVSYKYLYKTANCEPKIAVFVYQDVLVSCFFQAFLALEKFAFKGKSQKVLAHIVFEGQEQKMRDFMRRLRLIFNETEIKKDDLRRKLYTIKDSKS